MEYYPLRDEIADNKIVFYITFDQGWQRFDGYLFTWTKDTIAGLTWAADGKPYGFYATKRLSPIPRGYVGRGDIPRGIPPIPAGVPTIST